MAPMIERPSYRAKKRECHNYRAHPSGLHRNQWQKGGGVVKAAWGDATRLCRGASQRLRRCSAALSGDRPARRGLWCCAKTCATSARRLFTPVFPNTAFR
jgi:hypothetical protein